MKKILILMTCIYGGFASSGNDVPLNDIYTSLNLLNDFRELDIDREVIDNICLTECENVKRGNQSATATDMVNSTTDLFRNLIRVMRQGPIANRPDDGALYALDRLFEATTCMTMSSIEELLGRSSINAGNCEFSPEDVSALVGEFFALHGLSTKNQMNACFNKICYSEFSDCAEKNSNQNVLRIIKLLAGRGGLISKVHSLAVTIHRHIQDILLEIDDEISNLEPITLQGEVLLSHTALPNLPNEPRAPQAYYLLHNRFTEPTSRRDGDFNRLSPQAYNLLYNAPDRIANMTHDEQDMLDELCNLVTELTEGPTSA